jgi:competence protein ComEC
MLIWANWEWGNRKNIIYVASILFLIWSGDRLVRELKRPAEELLIFSGEKGIIMDFKLGSTHLSWNQDFSPEQIGFSIDPNRIAEHRPQIPESAKAIEKNKGLWFPVFDFQFDPERRIFLWNDRNPKHVEKISQKESKEIAASDSLLATKGAFRIVF